MHTLLARRNAPADMGAEIVPGLYEAEIDYLMTHEWAKSSADILWRRTKLGLHVAPGSAALLDEWIGARQGAMAL
jgi:glycerol-3-phosphate dehydrogenase